MEDRGFIIIKDAPCVVVLPECGTAGGRLIRDAVSKLRRNNPAVSVARLIDHCCERIATPGGVSVATPPPAGAVEDGYRRWADGKPVYVYDCADGTLRTYQGQGGARNKPKPENIGTPPG